jgi:hypothetical protein
MPNSHYNLNNEELGVGASAPTTPANKKEFLHNINIFGGQSHPLCGGWRWRRPSIKTEDKNNRQWRKIKGLKEHY